MRIPLEFYNHLRDSVRVSDIVRQKIVLTKKGGEYHGICPFHQEKTPSFTVNDQKKFYHCFGCSAHGDVIRFVSETDGLSYKDAAIKLAESNGIELPKMSAQQEKQYEEADHIYRILELALEFFQKNLNIDAKNYLLKRGVSAESIENFALGFAPGGGKLQSFFEEKSIPLKDLLKAGLVGRKEDGRIYEIFNRRIIFPIKNTYNKVVGFGGRAMGDAMPKYINSPETMVFKKGETMYGENIATGFSYKENHSIIVEGYMDVIALHQAGFKQSMASLGTAVTEKHLQKLWRSGDEIIMCLDGDSAGIRAGHRVIDMALGYISTDKNISFIELPGGLDPDDFIKKHSPKEFKNILDKRVGLSEMIWKCEYNGKSFKTAEARAALEQKLREYSSRIENKTLQDNFRRYFREMVWNHLIRRQSSKQNKEVLSQDVAATKQYSEIEILEHAICAFLIHCPEIISDEEISEMVHDFHLESQNLEEFKNEILDIIENQDNQTSLLMEVRLKNTRFYDTYLVLSAPDVSFLDTLFLNKNKDNSGQIFKWLCKKHYLLMLKQEYAKSLSEGASEAQSKSSSYIKEIQKISKELSQLNDNFINN
jgi:DNA primase